MTKARSLPKGAVRLSVEAVLCRATRESPLTAGQIADEIGQELNCVRMHIGNCVNFGLAYNLNEGHRGHGLSVWGQPERSPAVERVMVMELPVYVPPKSFCARAGALDAAQIPSVQDGQRVAHRPPQLMGQSLQ